MSKSIDSVQVLVDLFVDISCDRCSHIRTVNVGSNGLCDFCNAELDEMIDCVACQTDGFCLNHVEPDPY